MLSKSFIAFAFLLASISSTNAHAGVNPALGVKGQMQRSDVQRPSTNSPCGSVNIAQTLDSSTAVAADENGNFSPSITDFNAGADGSRSIKEVQVDASGTGKNFVPAKMIVNGNANPTTVGTDPLTAQLPAGTKCSGGVGKNLCLASFTTTAGFGNCVVVSQGAGASNASASQSVSGQPSAVRKGAAKGVARSTETPAANNNQKGQADKSKDQKKKNDKGKKKDDKKGKKGKGDNKKDAASSADSRVAVNDNKSQDAAAQKSKDGKKKDDKKKDKKDDKKKDKKKDDKKGKGAKKNQDDGKANKSAADQKNVKQANKRSWSSRQMGNFA